MAAPIDTFMVGAYRGVDRSPEILAYCAGVVDSDGTIGIKRNTYSMRVVGDSTQPTYSERVAVKQIEPQAVELLHSLFRGAHMVEKRTGGRSLFVWQVTDQRAVQAIEALLPYLRIKRAQAENCLALRVIKKASKSARVAKGRAHVGAGFRCAEHSAEMELAYQRAKELNRVGL